ncbi:hypothetical protein LCGC14_2721120 [marine sediment metagenome]|uniref:Uncharacterized protein n=1 Tax=marine sediment metagenome TaxID=412755 RepID=A0A0F9C1T4_9ZZZZ
MEKIDVNELCKCPLGTETDKRDPLYPNLCFYCSNISPKFKDLKRPLHEVNHQMTCTELLSLSDNGFTCTKDDMPMPYSAVMLYNKYTGFEIGLWTEEYWRVRSVRLEGKEGNSPEYEEDILPKNYVVAWKELPYINR